MSFSVDEKLVKKVGDKNDVGLTPEQEAEWLKCANDKYYFFENYCYVQAPKGKMLFIPRPYQRRIIDTADKHRLVIGVSGRQSGKCSVYSTKLSACKVINNGVEYELNLSLGEIHLLSKCSTPEEVEQFITNKRKSENENTTNKGDS